MVVQAPQAALTVKRVIQGTLLVLRFAQRVPLDGDDQGNHYSSQGSRQSDGGKKRPPTIGELPPGGKWVDINQVESIHAPDSIIYDPNQRQFVSRAEYYARKIAVEGYDLSKAIPVVETPEGRIIQTQGHHRLEALKILGYEQAPVYLDPAYADSWEVFADLADEFKSSPYYLYKR